MIQAGHEIRPLRIDPVKASWMRDWAEILQDPNEIHLDADLVRRLGLGHEVINQGPLNISYVINAAMQEFPGATVERFAVRLLGNVYAGDCVTAYGKVAEVEEISTGTRLTCDMGLAVEGRTDALSVTLTLRLN